MPAPGIIDPRRITRGGGGPRTGMWGPSGGYGPMPPTADPNDPRAFATAPATPQAPEPAPLPRNLNEFYSGYFNQPNIRGEIQNHPMGPTALFYQSHLADQEYRRAAQQQMNAQLGVLYRGREQSRRLLQGAGETAIKDAERASSSRSGQMTHNAIDRGYYTSSLADSYQRREAEGLDRTRGAIREDVAGRQAQMEGGYTQAIAGTMGSLNVTSPSYQLIADALRAKMTPANTGGQYGPLFGAVGAAAGGIIGGYAGGPPGALAGAQIGSGVGSGLGSYIR